MVTMRKVRLTWSSAAVALASMLSVAGCGEVTDAAEADGQEPSTLEQVSADAGTAGAAHDDQGVGDGKDVAMIGDSWMTMYGGGLQAGVNAQPGHKAYPTYGVPGTQLTNGQIPSQFTTAIRRQKTIKTIIMTGGGNDVLLTGASVSCQNKSCATLGRIREGLKSLWTTMAKAGVQDIVYMGYSEGAGSTPPEVTNAAKNGVSEICDSMTGVRCHWIDSTPIVRGRLQDGIHPTGAAHKDLGAAVYKLMTERGIRR